MDASGDDGKNEAALDLDDVITVLNELDIKQPTLSPLLRITPHARAAATVALRKGAKTLNKTIATLVQKHVDVAAARALTAMLNTELGQGVVLLLFGQLANLIPMGDSGRGAMVAELAAAAGLEQTYSAVIDTMTGVDVKKLTKLMGSVAKQLPATA